MDWLIGAGLALTGIALFVCFCWVIENDPVKKEVEKFYRDLERLKQKD